MVNTIAKVSRKYGLHYLQIIKFKRARRPAFFLFFLLLNQSQEYV